MIASDNEGSIRFRGWLIVVIAATAMVATLPGRTIGLGLITEPLLADLKLSRTLYANLNLVATLVGSAFGLFAGFAIDRLGLRTATAGTLFCLGVSVVLMGWVAGAGSLIVFLILSRGFGQSSLSTCSMTMVGKWFATHLSIALGVFTALVSVGFVVALSIAPMITNLGWRPVWIGGGGVLLGLSVVVAIFVSSRPHQLPGKVEASDAAGDATLLQALKSPSFWIYTACTGAYYLSMTGLTLFYEDVMAERGLDRSSYEIAMAAFMGAGLLGNFGAGFAARKCDLGRLLCFTMVLMAVYFVAFPAVQSTTGAAAHAALIGVAGGAFSVLFFTGYAMAFGKTHLGKIQGVAQTFMVIASAFGPKVFADTKDATGSYGSVFTQLLPIFVVLAIAAWFSGRWTQRNPSNQTLT